MNLTHKIFYLLDEGGGSSVTDALGNGPAGTVGGTLTNIWANTGCLTISNAQGAAGDNYIKLQNAHVDELCDLSSLNNQSLVLMFWFRQPTPVISGSPFVAAYGEAYESPNVTGFWGCAADNQFTQYYTPPGGTSLITRAVGLIEPLTSADSDIWRAYCIQIDVFDGKCCASACINGRPQRGARLFGLEDDGYPQTDNEARGVTLLAAANGAAYVGQMWGQSRVKRMFIGRTNGEQRNNIPKWANEFYQTASGIPSFMVV